MTKLRDLAAQAIAWVIQDDPGAWQKAVRDVVLSTIATAAVLWPAITLWVPSSVSDVKVLAIYGFVQVIAPALWVGIGVSRRVIWPLIVRRLWNVVAKLRGV